MRGSESLYSCLRFGQVFEAAKEGRLKGPLSISSTFKFFSKGACALPLSFGSLFNHWVMICEFPSRYNAPVNPTLASGLRAPLGAVPNLHAGEGREGGAVHK